MAEGIFYIVASILGFVIGGIVGEVQHVGWFPYAWYGLGVVWGVTICGHCGCHIDW